MLYQLIIIPITVAVLAQIIKLGIDTIKGNLNLKNIFLSYGGMPSAHTALGVSLCTLLAISFGVTSASFAIALTFTLIIMRDAMTFRAILGEQGKAINNLVTSLPKDKQKNFTLFQERIGHSPLEVAMGAVFGIVSTLLLYYLFV